MQVRQFEDLEIWQLARKLTNLIYDIHFGNNYGLANQMCRAAVSIMSNIAEGFERSGNQEFMQFLYIAKASCGELRSQLYIAHDRGYINSPKELLELTKVISGKIYKLIAHLKESGIRGIKYRHNDPNLKYQQELKQLYESVIKGV